MVNLSKEDELLYNKIYNEYKKDIYCYALKLTKNKDDAEDVVQESLLRAWCGVSKLKDVNSAKYWLMTIVKREFLRKINVANKMKTDDIDEINYTIESDINVGSEIELNEVLKVVMMLDDDYKDILILQGVYGCE